MKPKLGINTLLKLDNFDIILGFNLGQSICMELQPKVENQGQRFVEKSGQNPKIRLK
jgi:hypothetical protein